MRAGRAGESDRPPQVQGFASSKMSWVTDESGAGIGVPSRSTSAPTNSRSLVAAELDVVPLRTIAGPSATPSEPVAEANHHNLAWSPIPHVGVITQSTSIVVFETHRTVVDAPSITTSSDPEL